MRRLQSTMLLVLGSVFGWLMGVYPDMAGTIELPQQAFPIRFQWAFVAIDGPSLNPRFVTIRRDTTLVRGQQLKMYIESDETARCYLYVIYHGAVSGIQVLFPYTFEQFTTDYQHGVRYYIPKGFKWFSVDRTPGSDVVYVLASANRLADLESLLTRYAGSRAEERPHLAQNVVTKIRSMIKQYQPISKHAERPIITAGMVRDRKADTLDEIAHFAIEISATDFYCKTFTLDH